MVRKTDPDREDERVAFIEERVREIEAGLTADDVMKGYVFVELYLDADAAERKRMLATMPPAVRPKLRRLVADVMKRFPKGGAS
jgi:hypothetical protein